MVAEYTPYTLDNMGRYLCNDLDEALASVDQRVAGKTREFDVIVVGGGTFGSVIAHRLFVEDRTRSRRILVLEAGPFVLPEHNQNMSFIGGAPGSEVPWASPSSNGFPGLTYAIGGRSLIWGGWSPEPLLTGGDDEMRGWPAAVIGDLRGRDYFDAGDQIGVTATNDYIYGVLHTALRRQVFAGLGAAAPGPLTALPLAQLPDHPAVRGERRNAGLDPDVDNGTVPSNAQLRDWLGLAPTGPTPSRADMLSLLKLEAPLAVQARTVPGFFPINKFSAVPALTNAARTASQEADGVGAEPDARKRVMVVPRCRVLDLITETQADGWVRVTGVRVLDHRTDRVREVMLASPQAGGRQGVVVIALGTIESTRLARQTFRYSLAGRTADRMGENLMAHLRSNFTIRVPRSAVRFLPATAPNALPVSALFVKGKTQVGGADRYFHLQITASGLTDRGTNSEAELFRKVPDIEHVDPMLQATDTTVVITLRGIGEMAANNPDSRVAVPETSPDLFFGRPRAQVSLGDARAVAGGSAETQRDRDLWAAMDTFTDEVALIFADKEPFEILAMRGTELLRVIPVPANATAADLRALLPHAQRRDALGTTHHEAGTLRMNDNPALGVTNEFGRVHDTTNCYVVGPALLPTVGSPNPMLPGVALARRTARLLTASVLPTPADSTPQPAPYAADAGFTALFDGTIASFNRWERVSPGTSNGFALIDGQIVTYGGRDFGLLYYAARAFADFTLRVQFRVFDAQRHNSGIFVRFRDPLRDLPAAILGRIPADDLALYGQNRAWGAVHSGFEVQIDDTATGDSRRDFYGVRPEPNGLRKNRTGAIYKIPAGDPIPGSAQPDAALQVYQPAPNLVPGVWYEYEVAVQGDAYTVALRNLGDGTQVQTATFQNTDPLRGVGTENGQPIGYIGLQSYNGAPVAFGRIEIA